MIATVAQDSLLGLRSFRALFLELMATGMALCHGMVITVTYVNHKALPCVLDGVPLGLFSAL